MTAKTKIEWTDRTWNPIWGCSVVSAGCKNCYAQGIAARFSGPGLPYEGLAKMVNGKPHWTGKVKLVEAVLLEPLRWRKPCRVFVNSMSDLFHEGVPDSFIDCILAVIALTPHIIYQVLTKRAERMEAYFNDPIHGALDSSGLSTRKVAVQNSLDEIGDSVLEGHPPLIKDWPLPNLHLGVSVEDQAAADLRIPHLLRTPAAVRFISAEPLLGAVDISRGLRMARDQYEAEAISVGAGFPGPRLDWVICGGESGRGARPMNPDWARSLHDQCVAAGVAFFMKQLSGPGGHAIKDVAAFPKDLRIREYPNAL